MCPITPANRYLRIANNAALPESVRHAAKAKLATDRSFLSNIRAAEALSGEVVTTVGNIDFKC